MFHVYENEQREHMRVEIRKGRNGHYRKNWYGVYEINNKKYCINLGVEIKGNIPSTLKASGDILFERTRAKAEEKLANIVKEAKSAKNSQYILEKIYEQKTGNTIPEVQLCNLITDWCNIPRTKPLSTKYIASCKATLQRLLNFITSINPQLSCLSEISNSMFFEFLRSEESRGISAKTYNDTVKLLRTTWNKLLPGFRNPLLNIPPKQSNTCFRKPFTDEQLQSILNTANNDNFIYPIIVTGICTAMRRGDCCLLQWKNIDLANEFITVKTAKTGVQVEIPIWLLLKDVLLKFYTPNHSAEDYVFPEQAQMYMKNPDGISLRVKKLLIAAGIMEPGATRPSTGARIRQSPEYDFHSFRVTWVTIALSQGIPIEIVQRITGHSTVEVVTKHYFQPNREHFKRILENKLPRTLRVKNNTIIKPSKIDTSLLSEKIRSMNDDNWEAIRDEILLHYENSKV